MRSNVAALIASRTELLGPSSSPKSLASLSLLGLGTPIGGNDANFVLIPVLRDGEPNNERAGAVYKKMAEEKDVVVRFRGNELGCKGCLRITVGKEEENTKLLAMLKETLTEIS
jgi:histidinol-phosphate aminotransferase